MCFLARIVNGVPCIVCIFLENCGRYAIRVCLGQRSAAEHGFATHATALRRSMELARSMDDPTLEENGGISAA
ncbi:MAG: hypothetical protein H0S85_00940 [Desulfovibrionaceae bacterium]|jgi:hypothetical protein|nr:hypothetical protein [Desulfovibrionaceae bacterium]